MPKTSISLFALMSFFCLFASANANAQYMATWTYEQVLEEDTGYPVNIGPVAGQNSYAELSDNGPVVSSSISRAANSQGTGASIAAHQVHFKVVWHVVGSGYIPISYVLERAQAFVGMSNGVSVNSSPTSEGADAASNGISHAYVETYGHTGPYQTGHYGLDCFENIAADNQETCVAYIHTVAATSIAGSSYWARGIYDWRMTH